MNRLLGSRDLAELLGVHRNTAQRKIKSGKWGKPLRDPDSGKCFVREADVLARLDPELGLETRVNDRLRQLFRDT
ncbi:MAG: hypothetical protein GKS06_02475 [Acidobacteria bacterium]|nr:hypothetical protein [Acidobacteriota bacterium]